MRRTKRHPQVAPASRPVSSFSAPPQNLVGQASRLPLPHLLLLFTSCPPPHESVNHSSDFVESSMNTFGYPFGG